MIQTLVQVIKLVHKKNPGAFLITEIHSNASFKVRREDPEDLSVTVKLTLPGLLKTFVKNFQK